VSMVQITRAWHPMRGEQLPVLGQRRVRGRLELLVVLPDGSKSLIPAAWTDLDGVGVQEVAETADAAALGSLTQLLHACTVVRALLERAAQGREQAARQSPCEEDNRAACAAESDTGAGSGASTKRAGPAPRSAGRRRGRGAGDADRQDRQPNPGARRGRGGQR
jgi:Family of unknown function (DUF5372)